MALYLHAEAFTELFHEPVYSDILGVGAFDQEKVNNSKVGGLNHNLPCI